MVRTNTVRFRIDETRQNQSGCSSRSIPNIDTDRCGLRSNLHGVLFNRNEVNRFLKNWNLVVRRRQKPPCRQARSRQYIALQEATGGSWAGLTAPAGVTRGVICLVSPTVATGIARYMVPLMRQRRRLGPPEWARGLCSTGLEIVCQ